MALTLLGDSITKRTQMSPFSVDEAKRIGIQMVKRLEDVHDSDLVHRDIKPDNFLYGLGEDVETLFLIDFGLCKRFKTSTKRHIPMRTDRKIVGTPNFVSVNVHKGIEASRRDDLESVCYIMWFLLAGKLPWYQVSDMNVMTEMKEIAETPNDIVRSMLSYCRSLSFEERPKYDIIYKMLS